MKKILLSIVFVLILFSAHSQKKFSLPFSSSYDEDAIIMIGLQYNYINQNYQLTLKDGWQSDYPIDYSGESIHDLGNLKSIKSKNSHNFSVSIPVDVRANENLYFVFSPSFKFVDNSGIDFTGYETGNTDITSKTLTRRTRHLSSQLEGSNFNSFEFPISIKFRSDEKILKNKFNRYRGYIIGGARYSRFTGISKEYAGLLKERQNAEIVQSIIVQPSYLSWEIGIGVDIFFPYFKMSPEIKFNQSFKSVLDHNHELSKGNQFMAPLDKALIRNVYLSLIFQ